MRATGCSAPMGAARSLLLLAVLAFASCWGANAARAQQTWADPVPYCRAIGTIDAPDARYTGPKLPHWIVQALRRAVQAPPSAPSFLFHHTVWRCLEGQVMACTTGANIPCDQKADASRMPSRGAARYCAHSKTADVVPAYAAGRATVFEWRCAAGEPVAARQILSVDAAGYPSAFWHAVTP